MGNEAVARSRNHLYSTLNILTKFNVNFTCTHAPNLRCPIDGTCSVLTRVHLTRNDRCIKRYTTRDHRFQSPLFASAVSQPKFKQDYFSTQISSKVAFLAESDVINDL
jgi:hypothetical protein